MALSSSIETHFFADDGTVPNNRLPLVLYRGALGGDGDLATRCEEMFEANGWPGAWRNGSLSHHRAAETLASLPLYCAVPSIKPTRSCALTASRRVYAPYCRRPAEGGSAAAIHAPDMVVFSPWIGGYRGGLVRYRCGWRAEEVRNRIIFVGIGCGRSGRFQSLVG